MNQMNSDNKNPKAQDDEIKDLKSRVTTLEGQVLNCLRFIRFKAEQEASQIDPNFKVHESAKA
jgi:hypothetical protein